MSDPAKPPATIKQQSEFIEYLLARCRNTSGETSSETWLRLGADEVAELRHIAARLERIAPYEARIKDMVRGR